MEAHHDHAWMLMRTHAQKETGMHSRELGVEVVEGEDEDNARLGLGAAGRDNPRRLGWPRKVQRVDPPAVSSTRARAVLPPIPLGAQVAELLQGQQEAQPYLEQRAVATKGAVHLPRGKLHPAQHPAHAADAERDLLQAGVKEVESNTRKPRGRCSSSKG